MKIKKYTLIPLFFGLRFQGDYIQTILNNMILKILKK
jgi:hypothetical protein